MRMRSVLAFCAVAMVTTSAIAAPISTQPTAPSGLGGNVSLVFIGSDAGDTSSLSFGSSNNLFCNHASGSCGAATAGQTVDLGTQSGPLNFQLHDLSVANTFDLLGTASDGYYHASVSSNYADLGVFAIPNAASDAIAALTQQGGVVSYIGFEDRANGDYDYNDFVFAVIAIPPNGDGNQDGGVTVVDENNPPPNDGDPPTINAEPVPEPATLLLFGAGLLGIARRRRRA